MLPPYPRLQRAGVRYDMQHPLRLPPVFFARQEPVLHLRRPTVHHPVLKWIVGRVDVPSPLGRAEVHDHGRAPDDAHRVRFIGPREEERSGAVGRELDLDSLHRFQAVTRSTDAGIVSQHVELRDGGEPGERGAPGFIDGGVGGVEDRSKVEGFFQ